MLQSFRHLLGRRVSGLSLALFRICLGLVLAYDALNYLWPREGIGNFIALDFSRENNPWLFPYAGFEWVQPLPQPWLTGVFVIYGLAAVAMAAGLFTRATTAVVFLTYSYIFLLDATRYNNHYYLTVLITAIMTLAPTANCLSIDRLLRRRRSRRTVPDETIPFWPIFLLRFQWALVYLYGAVTKTTVSWLFYAQPLHTWLNEARIEAALARHLPAGIVGKVLLWVQSIEMAYFLSWSGMLFDLLVVPLLLIRRTRLLALVLAVGFHATNHWLLFDNIGWFPAMAMAGITLFLEPDWPRRLARWVRRPSIARPDWGWLALGFFCVPPVGALLGWKLPPSSDSPERPSRPLALLPLALICLWAAVQIVVPLRHFFIPGNVDWTAEGARFSWRMKAGQKQATRMEIFVDPGIAEDGSPVELDWDALGVPKRIYQDVPSRQVDFAELPELFVNFQPFYGERVIYNPFQTAGGSSRSLDEALRRVMTYWQATYGRQPKVHKTFPLFDVLRAVATQIDPSQITPDEQQTLVAAQRLAAELADETASSHESRQALIASLREQLFQLVTSGNRTLGELVQKAVAQAHPFATEGGLAPAGPLLVVDDPALFAPATEHGYATLDRAKWKPPTGTVDTVYADMDWMTQREWPAFPLVVLRAEPDGTSRIIWNQYADLRLHQTRIMVAHPFMCHQYAGRIAQWWEQRVGSRPRVFMQLNAELLPYELQPVLDPRVDLATAPLKVLSHNAWINQLRAEVPEYPASGSPANSPPPASTAAPR